MRKSEKKRPITAEELFDKIVNIMEAKGEMPVGLLDYAISRSTVPITTCHFDEESRLKYGGNEGIYLDLDIIWKEDGEIIRHSFGTFKTLDESDDAMYAMAKVLAGFTIELHKYVNANLDDFTWEGYDVYPCDESGNEIDGRYRWTCYSEGSAEQAKYEMLMSEDYVAIRDNATREVTIFHRETEE